MSAPPNPHHLLVALVVSLVLLGLLRSSRFGGRDVRWLGRPAWDLEKSDMVRRQFGCDARGQPEMARTHGTRSSYNAGCRCAAYREASRLAHARQREADRWEARLSSDEAVAPFEAIGVPWLAGRSRQLWHRRFHTLEGCHVRKQRRCRRGHRPSHPAKVDSRWGRSPRVRTIRPSRVERSDGQ